MQVDYRLKLGQDEFLLKVDVANAIEFFEKLSFYSGLPKTGPNGETDLKIVHRTTNQGYDYYSLVSEKAGQEFRFGQPKEDPKTLFPKGWSPIYRGEDQEQPQSKQTVVVQTQTRVPVPAQVATSTNTTVPQPTPTVATSMPTTNAVVQKSANDVLSRFGIKTPPVTQ